MAQASDFLIGANDEHGLNPPTAGKRTPILPYIDRSFYENEFNSRAKYAFMYACLRCGFRVYDVHSEVQDVSVSTRVTRINRAGLSLVVTFAYNALGDGQSFSSAEGIEVYYSPFNRYSVQSRSLSERIFEKVVAFTGRRGRFVGSLSVGVLSSVNCPSSLIEAGYMTNFKEAKLMLNPSNITAVGEGACAGVCEYLGVPYLAREINNYKTIRINSSGNYVYLLQYLLNDYGANLQVDGKFGANTENAVKKFQTDNGLSADGVVGPNTWNKLLNLNPDITILRKGDKGSAVLYLQQMLLSYLYPIKLLDGVFGSETENAVNEFQRENGLVVDGIVGKNTWRALRTSSGRQIR